MIITEYQALRNKIFVDKTIDGVDLDYNIHIKDLMTYYENEKVNHLKTFANLGLRTLHVVNIGAGQFNNLETYQNQITSLTQQVNTLQSQIPTAERSILINTDVNVEAELDDASFDAAVTFTSGASNLAITAGGVVALDGDVNAINGKVNLLFHPFDNKQFTPYIGGGLGLAAWEANLDSITFNGSTLTVNGSEDGTDLTAEAIVGLDAAVSDSVTFGGRYTYLWTDTGTAFTDDVTAHMVKFNVGMKF